MLKTFNKKSLLTLYISVVRPCFILAQNMSENVDADKYSVAYVTVPSIDVGKTISRGLVENKLAACVNIIPQITSVYEWEGKINEDEELLLMIKTRTTEVNKLTDYVRSNHPYTVCEVISLPIKNGNPPYLKWLGDMVPESPQAQTDTSQAQSVTSQAQTDTSQGQTDTSQAQTETSQAQTETSQAQTDTSQAQSDSSQTESDTSQAQADTSQAQPANAQAQPDASQAQPDATQAQPDTTQAQPVISPQAQLETAPAQEGKHCKGSTCPN